MKIVLISCVSQKLNRSAQAQNMYISDLFTKNLAYAKKLMPDAIYILSAKYGLLGLKDEIEPYNVTLIKMTRDEIRVWSQRVLKQLSKVSNLKNDLFIFLAGEKYRMFLLPYIRNYEIPMEGLRIGEQLHFLSNT